MADKLSNTGIGTPDAEIAAACLTEYMQGFQKRNPLTVEQYKEYAKIIEQVEKKNGEVTQSHRWDWNGQADFRRQGHALQRGLWRCDRPCKEADSDRE